MSIKIVLDSAADLTSMEGVEMSYAPMKVCTAERDFCDDGSMDASAEILKEYAAKDARIFDTRNCLDGAKLKEIGFKVLNIGK